MLDERKLMLLACRQAGEGIIDWTRRLRQRQNGSKAAGGEKQRRGLPSAVGILVRAATADKNGVLK